MTTSNLKLRGNRSPFFFLTKKKSFQCQNICGSKLEGESERVGRMGKGRDVVLRKGDEKKKNLVR